MATFFSGFKDGFTLVKEQDGIIDLGFSEDEFEIFSSTHAAQWREVYKQYLQLHNSMA